MSVGAFVDRRFAIDDEEVLEKVVGREMSKFEWRK